jgi:hypothetical protein
MSKQLSIFSMLKKDGTTERSIKHKVDIETKYAKKKFKDFKFSLS